MYTFKMFVYRKITKIAYSYKIAVLVMTEIIIAHNQKHVHCHYFFGWSKHLVKMHPSLGPG